MQALGNFINGGFVAPSGKALVSRNPAADGAVVFETANMGSAGVVRGREKLIECAGVDVGSTGSRAPAAA